MAGPWGPGPGLRVALAPGRSVVAAPTNQILISLCFRLILLSKVFLKMSERSRFRFEDIQVKIFPRREYRYSCKRPGGVANEVRGN